MHLLTRVVRVPLSATPCQPGSNGLVGSSAAGLAGIGEFHVACRGELLESGYLVDITVIDRAVRAVLPPRVSAALREELRTGNASDLVAVLRDASAELAKLLPAPLAILAFRPSPFLETKLEFATVETDGSAVSPSTSPSAPDRSAPSTDGTAFMTPTVRTIPDLHAPLRATPCVILRETFEFAASHRLHLAVRTDAENRALFGKCNNPNGHGHNYRIAVSVEVDADAPADARPGFAALERIVETEIMSRFDHKHLNLDCPEFATTNPSVENIARICFEVLNGPCATAGGRLRDVEVWETDKTSCRYSA